MKQFTLFVLASFTTISSYAIAPITGPTTVCAGDTIILYDATPGGTWSSSATATATVGTDGFVVGVAAGVATISYTSGSSTAILSVTVNPLPMLSSTLTPPAICDSSIFRYTPAGSIPGISFTWSRAYISGILNLAAMGVGSVNEALINSTANPISVVYIYTLSSASCMNTENVSVIVNPTPVLSSALILPHICDSVATISYTPTSFTPGTTFAWDRPAITGITPTTGFASAGTGVFTETLTDAVHHPVTIDYFYRLAIGGCVNLYTQMVQVTIDTCSTLYTPIIKSTSDIIVSPNPTNDQITITGVHEYDAIDIFNTLGKKVYSKQQLSGNIATINLSNQPNGIYYVVVNSGGTVQTRKIVKQ